MAAKLSSAKHWHCLAKRQVIEWPHCVQAGITGIHGWICKVTLFSTPDHSTTALLLNERTQHNLRVLTIICACEWHTVQLCRIGMQWTLFMHSILILFVLFLCINLLAFVIILCGWCALYWWECNVHWPAKVYCWCSSYLWKYTWSSRSLITFFVTRNVGTTIENV